MYYGRQGKETRICRDVKMSEENEVMRDGGETK